MVLLCVMFNHAYPKNIPVLREVYSGRFSDVIYLQPLVESDDDDVFTVYRGSFTFQGMLVDVRDRILQSGASHLVVVHDDVLLHPSLNEDNIVSALRIQDGGCFFPNMGPAPEGIYECGYTLSLYWKTWFSMNYYSGSGVDSLIQALPDPAFARERIRQTLNCQPAGVRYDPAAPMVPLHIFGDSPESLTAQKAMIDALFSYSKDGVFLEPPYPYVVGWSDFFAIDMKKAKEFLHLLGIFAAGQIFVEAAIPTSLAITADSVTSLSQIDRDIVWVPGSSVEPIEPDQIVDAFRGRSIAMHPLKLSRDRELTRQIFRELEPGRLLS